MSEHPSRRRLAAIMVADVVGYSRLMGQDEAGTLAALRAARTELIEPKIAEHTGRVFKSTGDGLLAEFPSVVSAVACATEIQRGMKERSGNFPDEKAIQLRIGINLGDIIVEDGDVFGDGVNVASRIESIAPSGGVAVSGTVRDHIGNRLDLHFEDMGEQTLKNIDRPVRVYIIGRGGARSGSSYPTLPDRPSIAVLPFENLSGDREQEYFADGMVEEIITALSRFHGLFVIARNSSFTYKGRAVDVKQVGRELGVRYVLEGSVRKAGSRVRITGQLINTSSGAHLWADRFEGDLANIFDLQDQVTSSVVGAISPKLDQAEIERSIRKTESLDAYDYFLRGLAAFNQWTKDTNFEAERLFYKAIELDPLFASAYGMAVRCHSQRKTGGWVLDRDRDIAEVLRLARRASELGKGDALALSTAGIGLAYVASKLNEGRNLIQRALALNPNLASAWLFSGWVQIWLGEPEKAIERLTRAMRLSPQDPQMFSMQTAIALAHFFAGRYVESFSWAETAMQEQPSVLTTCCVAAASSALTGQKSVSEQTVAHIRLLDPTLRISNLGNWFPFKSKEDLQKLADALGVAGLPE